MMQLLRLRWRKFGVQVKLNGNKLQFYSPLLKARVPALYALRQIDFSKEKLRWTTNSEVAFFKKRWG